MRFFEIKWLTPFLWPLSLLYGFFIQLRNALFDLKIFRIHHISCHVISVGNLTIGGTGKTPTVLWLAEFLSRHEKSVCVLSRGYHRTTRSTVVVSNGQGLNATVEQSGDEPYLMALRLKGIPVVVDSDRVRGARLAIEKFSPDVIILDDGFQHRRLHRDLDIVTMPYPRPFGNGLLLPAGPLRESRRHLQRAGMLWINSHKTMDNTDVAELKSWQPIPQVKACYQATHLVDSRGIRQNPDLHGIPIVAFCALGNPDGFYASLLELGAEVKEFIIFPDHHWYSIKDIDLLQNKLLKFNARFIITTEKDWVKLNKISQLYSQWNYVVMQIVPENDRVILQVLKNSRIISDL